MSDDNKLVSYPDLKGSEQHFDLKNQPGEKGDKDHAASDETLKGKAADTVKSSDADTQMADAMRVLTKK